MKTTRAITISALNIAMHAPHSAQRYVDLLWETRRSRRVVGLGELHGAMLGHLNGKKTHERGMILTGEIYRFVKIDPDMPWFDLTKSEAATDDELAKINIPTHLLPNLQRIEFCFLPEKHRLWFISRDRKDSLSPLVATKFFQTLLDHICIQFNFPKVEVTAIPDSDSIETLLSTHRIDRIELELVRPNPDDNHSTEARWKAKLERLNARKIRTEIAAANSDGLVLNQEDKDDAKAIANNGSVRIVGANADGTKVDESTINRPMRKPAVVDSAIETSLDVLLRHAT